MLRKAVSAEVKKSSPKPNPSPVDTAAIQLDEVISKMEKKYQKKEMKFRSQIENLIKRVELLYNQVTDQRLQLEKLKKDRDEYKMRFETEQSAKMRLQRDLWKMESNLDQEQFKRDQVELKMGQLKQQISGFFLYFRNNFELKNCFRSTAATSAE